MLLLLVLLFTVHYLQVIFQNLKEVAMEREGRKYASEKEQYANRLPFTSKEAASFISKCVELVRAVKSCS